MIELFQHEDSPECARVRRHLAAMRIDFIARQVPPDDDGRFRLERTTGQSDVPVLLDLENGMVVTEADDIIAYLDETFGAAGPSK